ncbi:unnamed protein product [Lathyrus oleraceus]
MANESEPVVCEDAIPPQKICKKRKCEDEDQNEVITEKKKRGEVFEILEDRVGSNSDYSEHDKPEGLESLEYNEEEVEGKVSKTPQERHGSPVTLNENYAASKTICVKNLSYSVEHTDMEDIFKDCGEVVDIQFKTDCEGRFRGFGFVKFETVEAAQKALKLHNTELLNRRIKINIAQEKSEYPPCRSSFHTDGNLYSHTVKGFDASLVENKPKSPVTPNETKGTLKTVYVGNLSYTVERADMEKLFKGYGEIVDIRLHTDREGKFKGNGHVQFATEESAQKALVLNKKVFFNRPMVVNLALERRKYSPNESWSIQFHKCGNFQPPLTVSVIGFNTSLAEEKIKASLHNHFECCGEIARILLPRHHGSGVIKEHAFLDFKDIDGYKNALKLNQTEIGGYWVSVVSAGGGKGNYRVGGRGGGDYGGSRGGYRVGGRDGANYRSDNQGMGGGRGSYHVCGRGGGDCGGRASWGRSHGAERHWTVNTEHW